MPPLFLYGTLLHRPLLEIVGGPGAATAARPAELSGHQVRVAGQESYPRIEVGAGRIEGLLIDDAEARARSACYEGGFGYGLAPVTVLHAGQPLEAELYWPGPNVPAAAGPWDLGAWEARWARLTCAAASEAMEYFEQISPQALAARMGTIRARAHARILAEDEPPVPRIKPAPAGERNHWVRGSVSVAASQAWRAAREPASLEEGRSE